MQHRLLSSFLAGLYAFTFSFVLFVLLFCHLFFHLRHQPVSGSDGFLRTCSHFPDQNELNIVTTYQAFVTEGQAAQIHRGRIKVSKTSNVDKNEFHIN